MRKISGRIMLISLLIPLVPIILLGILYLITPRPEKRSASPAQVSRQISLHHYFSGDLSGGLAEMLAVINERDPNQQVNAHSLDHEAFKSMIISTLDKGRHPDLFSYWAGAKTLDLVERGRLTNLDDIWQQAKLDERFTTPVTRAASSYAGSKYLLPIAQHMVVFFYNVQLFEELHLVPPTTWVELLDITKKIQAASRIPFALGARERWPAQFWFDYLLLRTAGLDYRQALMESRARYTDPQVQKAFGMWAELLTSGTFNVDANERDWGEATRMLCTGQAAMTLMGTWAIQLLNAPECGLAEESGFDFFAFPTIDPRIARTAVGPVDGIALASSAANQEFAKSILSYFSESEPQKIFSRGSGAFAPSSQVPADFYSPLKRRILAESAASSHWAFNYDLATHAAVAELGMDSFNELIAFPGLATQILEDLQVAVDSTIKESKNTGD